MNHGVLEGNLQRIFTGTINRNTADFIFYGYVSYLVDLVHLIVHCGRLRPDPLSPRPGGLCWKQDPYGFLDEGMICATIDGGTLMPLAPVDNASRVIKYVGILGYRYQSYGLVDMRIHDISVVADLTRSNPIAPAPGEPVEYDGSDQSVSPKTQDEMDDHLSLAMSNIHTYWTGWWPMLHFVGTNPASQEIIFHMAVDLIGNSEVYTSDSMGANEEDFNNAMLVAGFGFMVGLWLYALIMTCAVAEKTPTGWAAIAAVVGVLLITLGVSWCGAHALVDNGNWAAGSASVYFIVLALGCLSIAAGLKSIGGIAAGILLSFLAFLMKTTFEAIKAAIKFTIWSRMIFIAMALIFAFIYAPHFYSYEV